jgi:hypothetical protein
MQDPATGYVVGQELNKVDQATRAGSADVNKDLGADKNSSAYQITKILSSAAVQIGLLFAGGEAAKAEQAMEQTLAPAITKAEQDLAPALQLTEEAKTAAAEVKPSPPAPGAPASAKSAPTGQSYSVAFQTELKPTSYPGLSRAAHFQESNEALLQAMETNPNLAKIMNDLGINLERTPKGLAPRQSPPGWTWHHANEPGIMQLVPREQHAPGSIWQDAFHPDGQGGYSIWGN